MVMEGTLASVAERTQKERPFPNIKAMWCVPTLTQKVGMSKNVFRCGKWKAIDASFLCSWGTQIQTIFVSLLPPSILYKEINLSQNN